MNRNQSDLCFKTIFLAHKEPFSKENKNNQFIPFLYSSLSFFFSLCLLLFFSNSLRPSTSTFHTNHTNSSFLRPKVGKQHEASCIVSTFSSLFLPAGETSSKMYGGLHFRRVVVVVAVCIVESTRGETVLCRRRRRCLYLSLCFHSINEGTYVQYVRLSERVTSWVRAIGIGSGG